ncbi:MAG: tetratricopeptide repeat protein [Desulfobacteraceae bacterium]|jgi:adenylate cyclase
MNTHDFKRKLTTVFSADVVGYSRLMGEDEAETVRTLEAYKQVMFSLIKQHRGGVIDSPGDNILAEFASVVDAVQCGVAAQKELQARNAGLPESRRMEFRIGINLGDVIEEGDRIYGDGVNIAARLEALADPGGICISKTAFDHIEAKLPLGYHFLGEQTVKNIAKPVGAYKVLMEPRVTVGEEREEAGVIPFWRRKAGIAGAITALVVIIGVVVSNVYLRRAPIEPASVEKMAYPLPEKPSIAVLPFENLSGDPQQEYISDGISEAIINALSKVPRMFVIARNSSFTYRGKPVKVQQVAEELGVRYVLEGSVQRSGEKLRVTAQLIDAIKGHHLWSERYDVEMDDLLALQDKIALNILVETQVKLTEGEQARLLKKETNNLKAYEKYLEATKYYYRTNREDMFKARQLYEEAIKLDPNFSGAYRGIGGTHYWDAVRKWSHDPDKSWHLATEYAQKALAMDENNWGNLLSWSRIVDGNGEHEKAIEICRRVLELNPNRAIAYFALAGTLFNAGRCIEAIPLHEKALRLNPFPPAMYYRNSGLYYWFAGRYEDAIAASKKALHVNPNDITTFRNLAAIHAVLGNDKEARAAAAEVLRLDPSFTIEREFRTVDWKDREGMERFKDALRKAGLPYGKSSLPVPDKPSIAVLPFENMSGDPEQEYFSDGITEEIITALSKVPDLSVIARNSSFTYKGKSVSIPVVGRELGVRYVLEGSVRKASNKVRVTAQLIDAQTNNHLWAERYDRDLKDIFALQDEITMKILTAVRVELTEGEQARLYGKRARNLDSFMKVLEGRPYFYRFSRESNLQARQMFEEAIALEPENAHAFTMLGWTYLMEVWFGSSESPSKAVDRVVELAQKALSLDDTIDSPHSLLAHVYLMKRQFEMAIAEAERAVALSPNGADAQAHLGMILNYAGRRKAAIASLEKAMRLNPIPPNWYLFSLGEAYCFAGEHEEALAAYEQVLRGYPEDIRALIGSTATYSLLGREEEARAQAAQILKMEPKFSLESFVKTFPLKNKADAELLFDSLHKAGLK